MSSKNKNKYIKSKEKLNIYLADLDHFFLGNRISVPLGIGSIKSYCMSQFGEDIDIKLFKHPEKLMEEVNKTPPDILGCSFYMWNKNITLKVLECCRKISPSTITVIGGPNVARITDRYIILLKENPSIDIVVLDQGEKTFASIVHKILINGLDRDLIFSDSIQGSAIRKEGKGPILRGEIVKDISGLNKMPSPYLQGYLYKFIKDGFLPTFETVRGCPHQCTYCGGGDKFVSRLIIKDENVVYEELRYLLKNSITNDIDLIDTNFGLMGERDLRIISFIQDMYTKHKFPFIAGFATSKDRRRSTVEIMRILAEITGVLKFGVQTLTTDVLQNCKRKNVHIDEMRELINLSKKTSMPVQVELIFGLPGETKSSFIKTMSELRSLGIESVATYQLRLLSGTQLSEFEREIYNYKSKFRPINNRFGEYQLLPGEDPIRVVEVEEIAIESNSFDFEDYLFVRELGFMETLLTGYGTFSDTLAFLLSKSIDIIDIMQYIQQNQDKYLKLHLLFKDYRKYSENELSPSEEALIDILIKDDLKWNDLISSGGNYFKLNIGFVGYCLFHNIELLDNIAELIIHYAKQKLTSEEITTLKQVIEYDRRHWLIQDKKDGRLKLSDIIKEISFDDHFDYDRWKIEGASGNLNDYKLPKPIQQIYYIKEYENLVKTIKEQLHLISYNFYERITLQSPSVSLKRYIKRA